MQVTIFQKCVVFLLVLTSIGVAGIVYMPTASIFENFFGIEESSIHLPEEEVVDEEREEVDDIICTSGAEPTCVQVIVDGIIKQCCKNEYSAYYNCTAFAYDFHELCLQENIACNSVAIHCEGGGHMINMVYGIEENQWCLVEPQGTDDPNVPAILRPCFDDPTNPPDAAVCAAVNKPLNADGTCPCSVDVYEDPAFINSDPVFCSSVTTDFTDCTFCCDARPEIDDAFFEECRDECIRHADPRSCSREMPSQQMCFGCCNQYTLLIDESHEDYPILSALKNSCRSNCQAMHEDVYYCANNFSESSEGCLDCCNLVFGNNPHYPTMSESESEQLQQCRRYCDTPLVNP